MGCELAWWERQLLRNRFTFWAGSWICLIIGVTHRQVRHGYDTLMIRLWPYGRWPGEWKDMFARRDGWAGQKEKGER